MTELTVGQLDSIHARLSKDYIRRGPFFGIAAGVIAVVVATGILSIQQAQTALKTEPARRALEKTESASALAQKAESSAKASAAAAEQVLAKMGVTPDSLEQLLYSTERHHRVWRADMAGGEKRSITVVHGQLLSVEGGPVTLTQNYSLEGLNLFAVISAEGGTKQIADGKSEELEPGLYEILIGRNDRPCGGASNIDLRAGGKSISCWVSH